MSNKFEPSKFIIMAKKHLTGLSLSLCIKDIINGVVEEEQVETIIARTLARDSDEWHSIISQYQSSCWKEDPAKAYEIFHRLLMADKIKQPRLEGGSCEDVRNGHWR